MRHVSGEVLRYSFKGRCMWRNCNIISCSGVMGFRGKGNERSRACNDGVQNSYQRDSVGNLHGGADRGSHLYLANSVVHDHAKHINMNDET